LSQVERGVRSVDRLSLLLDMSLVLHVEVEALTGRPWQYAPNCSELVEGLDSVRRVLARYDALITGALDPSELIAAQTLHKRAADIHSRYQAANYGRVIRELPELIIAADQVHRAANGNRELLLGYVSVYVAAAKLLTKLGSADLAAVAAGCAAMTAGTLDSLPLKTWRCTGLTCRWRRLHRLVGELMGAKDRVVFSHRPRVP
jgi:hypothetical protein